MRAYSPPSHWLRRGDTGPEVAAWQALLVELGYAPGAVDGVFGSRTEAATRLLQRDLSTGADGVVDRITFQRAAARRGAPPPMRGVVLAPERRLGERALAIAIREIGRCGASDPGVNARVAEYLSGCQRGVHPPGFGPIDEPAWSYAFIGYCEHKAARPGDSVLPWRASVAEGWLDAARAGKARPRSYRPRAGDVALFARGGGDPRRCGPGHAAFVASLPDEGGAFSAVGGDDLDEVSRVERNIADPSLVGWIQID